MENARLLGDTSREMRPSGKYDHGRVKMVLTAESDNLRLSEGSVLHHVALLVPLLTDEELRVYEWNRKHKKKIGL